MWRDRGCSLHSGLGIENRVVAHSFSSLAEDGLLFDICDDLQLSTARHDLAVEREDEVAGLVGFWLLIPVDRFPAGKTGMGSPHSPALGNY
jgi:hypothetical protein